MRRWGDLLPMSTELANYWLERAAQGAHGGAQHLLAWYYETGQYGYPGDKAQADAWYRRALVLENPETLYLFATRQFKDGEPTAEAVALLRKAAEKGFKQADQLLRFFIH